MYLLVECESCQEGKYIIIYAERLSILIRRTKQYACRTYRNGGTAVHAEKTGERGDLKVSSSS